MKVLFCQNITREKLREAVSYEKRARKMLVKLTQGCTLNSKPIKEKL